MSVTMSQLLIYSNLEGFSSGAEDVPKNKLGPHIILRCVICDFGHITDFYVHVLQTEFPSLSCST
jgi:hypothetical protein